MAAFSRVKYDINYYFVVELCEPFSQDITIENNKKIKDWIKEYKEEYEGTIT